MLAIRQTIVAVRGGDTMNGVKRSEQAISAFIFLSKYCETEKCDKCVFNTGGVGTKQEYGCGLVAALSDHRRFSTVLERAINRGEELEHEQNTLTRFEYLQTCTIEEMVDVIYKVATWTELSSLTRMSMMYKEDKNKRFIRDWLKEKCECT